MRQAILAQCTPMHSRWCLIRLATARAHLATAKAEAALTGATPQFDMRGHLANANVAISPADAVVTLPPRPRAQSRAAGSQPELPIRSGR